MSALLQEVAKSISTPPTPTDLEQLKNQLNDAIKKKEKLFGIEKDAKQFLSDKIATLEEAIDKDQTYQLLDGKYLPIDMSCLSWRDENGLPKLTLFDLDKPEFHIACSARAGELWHDVLSYHIPSSLRAYYLDVRELLSTRAKSLCLPKRFDRFRGLERRATCTISSRFSGVIPESTREKIEAAKSIFADGEDTNIFIMGDPVYQIVDDTEIVSVSFGPDPLVLGFALNQLFLIDEFDITPIEEAALLQPFMR